MTNSINRSTKSIMVIVFTIKKGSAKWHEWSKKVLTFGRTKNWREALKNNQTVKEIKAKASPSEMEIRQLKKDEEVMIFLTLSCKDKAFSSIDMVNRNSTFQIWKKLQQWFEPKEVEDYLFLEAKSQTLKITDSTSNPRKLIDTLKCINQRMRGIDKTYRKHDM